MTPNQFSPRNGLNKIVQVNAAAGNRGLQKQQASTRVIYDSLLQNASGFYRFFDNVASRTFPQTNLSENKLQVNESMVIKWINFHTFTIATGSAPVTAVAQFSATPALVRSDVSIEIANSVVLKPYPLDTMLAANNRHAQHTAHESVMLETDLVIPSLLEFIVNLRTTYVTSSTTVYNMCMLEGQATIYRPQGSY